MGASLYHNLAPWHADPNIALQQLQIAFFEQHHDLEQEIQQHLESTRQSVRWCEEDDEHGLLEIYQTDLRRLEGYASQPLPNSPIERIAMLRKMWESGGEGLGNILDLRGVSDAGDYFVARRMRDEELERVLGTSRPAPMQSETDLGAIPDQIDRGQCVCFPVYERDQPCGWQFVGYSID